MAEYEAATEQLTRRVYLGLREDNLDPQHVVALACALLDWFRCTDAILEVVQRNPAEVPRAEMTALARCILDEVGFEPGFDLAPERLETLREALRVVARDLRMRGIEGEPEIEVLEDRFPVGAGVRLADGQRLSWGGPVLPGMCDEPTMALTSLTIMIQESLLEWTWQVWPVCPRHDLGVHGSERGREVVWWCAGDGGHTLAPVGELARTLGCCRSSEVRPRGAGPWGRPPGHGGPCFGFDGAGFVEGVSSSPDLLGDVHEVQQDVDRDTAASRPGTDQVALWRTPSTSTIHGRGCFGSRASAWSKASEVTGRGGRAGAPAPARPPNTLARLGRASAEDR